MIVFEESKSSSLGQLVGQTVFTADSPRNLILDGLKQTPINDIASITPELGVNLSIKQIFCSVELVSVIWVNFLPLYH